MSRYSLILGPASREKARKWLDKAPDGWMMELLDDKRSNEQNRLLWPLLSDLSAQVTWHGVKLSPDDWKLMMLAGLKEEMRLVPNIDGTGLINLGRSSSRLSKSEFSDLLEVVFAFGAREGVVWSKPDA
jgi:hypothetical protein